MHDKILIAKMRAGQQIEVECHATKGLGAEHAKWSPVATAWYRLLPEVSDPISCSRCCLQGMQCRAALLERRWES